MSPLSDILDIRDKSLLTLEASSFARKYPSVHAELLSSLLLAREDIGRNEAKSIAEDALNNVRLHPKNNKEMEKLFELCKAGGKRQLPAIEDLRSVFNTFAFIASNKDKS